MKLFYEINWCDILSVFFYSKNIGKSELFNAFYFPSEFYIGIFIKTTLQIF